ncbi:hypothetical protein XELAEV_18040683mg [Xenopus laevis]|uniref:Immunoglobulin V-set domain-containing protein n=1 Tax=Xenopus laevis TaxID=8355 RepID=A0A974CA83_XENLA|nr:hypothetical protein XELAEV_18040683mg [Xenopus laevis]
MSLGYWKLIVLTLLPYSVYTGPCGPMRNITGKEGETATLQVAPTGDTEIAWMYVSGSYKILIAITKPNTPIHIQDPQFKGRVSSSTDGSLIFTNFTKKFRGVYTAHNPHTNCNQFYNLRVYNNDQIQPGEYIYYLTGLVALLLILGFIWFFVRKRRKRPDYENQNVVEEMGAENIENQEREKQRKKLQIQNERNMQNPEYENQNVVEEMGAQIIQPQETDNQRRKPRSQNDGNEQQNNSEPLYESLTSSFSDYDVIKRQS